MALENFANQFYQSRKVTEGHRHTDFFVHGPMTNLVQMLATGFLKDRFYMGGKEIVEESLIVHKEAIAKDKNFHYNALKIFRNLAYIKDQVLIGLAFNAPDSEVLKTFPPHLLIRYVDLLRKMKVAFGHGFSRHAKRLVGETMQSWDDSKFQYYSMTYRDAMLQLCRVAHPSFSADGKDTQNKANLIKWLIDIEKAPTDETKAASTILKGGLSTEAALDLIEKYHLPFEFVRSHIKLPDHQLPNYGTMIQRIIGSSALALNLRLLRSLIGDSETAKIVANKHFQRVSAYRLLVAAAETRNELPETFKALDKKYFEALSHIDLLPNLKETEFALVLDASGSMFKSSAYESGYTRSHGEREIPVITSRRKEAAEVDYEFNILAAISPYLKLCKGLAVFHDSATVETIPKISSITDLVNYYWSLRGRYGGGTNISSGLELALRSFNVKHLLLCSDEQENAGQQAINFMSTKKGVSITTINPSPYPAHAISTTKEYTYIPAATPEAINAWMRLQQLYNLTSEESVRHYVEELIEKIIVESGPPETETTEAQYT